MFIDLKTKISRKVARRIIVNTIRHLIYFRKENKDKTRGFLKGFLAALWKIDLLTTKNRSRFEDYVIKRF